MSVSEVITLGIGTPSTIPHFLTLGLFDAPAFTPFTSSIDLTGESSSSVALSGRSPIPVLRFDDGDYDADSFDTGDGLPRISLGGVRNSSISIGGRRE